MMGYTTEFDGCFTLNKPLDDETYNFLVKLNETRRMKRNLPEKYGVDGEFYVEGGGEFGQDKEENVVDSNVPPSTQPGLWCQWVPSEDRLTIGWDEGEKFYDYIEWIKYIIEKILTPRGYVLSGAIKWEGEENSDMGIIEIHENKVVIKRGYVSYKEEDE